MKTPNRNSECLYCTKPLLKKAWRKFCGHNCRKSFNNRRATRGALIYDLCMKWRKDRKKEGFSDLCHQIGIYISDDNAKGITTYHDYEKEIPWQIPLSRNDINVRGVVNFILNPDVPLQCPGPQSTPKFLKGK